VWVGETVKVHVDQGQPHHVGRNIVALEVLREATPLIRRQGAISFGVCVRLEDVLVR
jgi:hypothetical protein